VLEYDHSAARERSRCSCTRMTGHKRRVALWRTRPSGMRAYFTGPLVIAV